MKKLLAWILTIASVVSMLTVMPVFAENTPSLSQDQTELLTYVGVYDAEQDLSEPITKAEFALLLSKVAFGLNTKVELYATGSKAADVNSTHPYYTEICALLSSGYISTNKFGNYLPDTNLNINTAYEFILRTLGYSETEDFKAGKFGRLAAQKDLADGLVGADGELTFQNAYILIYNMLHTDIADMMSLVYSHIPSNKELLFMQTRLGLYDIKGIVQDDGLFSLYGESDIKKGQIVIGNNEAMTNGTTLVDLVGKNVAGYYKQTDKDEYELVVIYEQLGKNEYLELKSENVIKPYTNNTYEYYEDEFSVKVKKVKVLPNATIIYNNKALTLNDTFTQADFIPENGIIKLYDNDGDGTMDIIRIEDYKEAVATVIDSGEEVYICFKHTNEVVNLDDVSFTAYSKEGEEIPYGKIRNGAVLSVLKSRDGETYKMIMCTDTATAEVKSVVKSTPSQRGHLITTEGGKYSFSQWLEDHYGTPEMGSTYKFSFDAFGRIVDLEKVSGSNDWLVGFLLSVQLYNDAGGEILIKMFNDAGAWENLKPAQKVTVLGEDDSTTVYSPSELTGLTYQGLIRYKLNSKGEVSSIELPMYYGTKPSKPDRLFCMLDTITEAPSPAIEGDPRKYANKADYYTYRSGGTMFGNAAYADSSLRVFITPKDEDLNAKYKEIKTADLSSIGAGTSTGVRVYGTDFRSFKASYVVTNVKPTAAKFERDIFYITSVRLTTDPKTGDVVYQVETIDRAATKGKYYIEKDYYENGIKSVTADPDTGAGTPIQLQPGDGIYRLVYDGYIIAAVVFYDASQEAYDSHGSKVVGMVPNVTTTEFSKTNPRCNPFGFGTIVDGGGLSGSGIGWKFNGGEHKVFVGWVYNVDGSFVTITNQNPASGPLDTTLTLDDGITYETVNIGSYVLKRDADVRAKNTIAFEKGAVKDLKPYTKYGQNCSMVIVTKTVYEMVSFTILNKN